MQSWVSLCSYLFLFVGPARSFTIVGPDLRKISARHSSLRSLEEPSRASLTAQRRATPLWSNGQRHQRKAREVSDVSDTSVLSHAGAGLLALLSRKVAPVAPPPPEPFLKKLLPGPLYSLTTLPLWQKTLILVAATTLALSLPQILQPEAEPKRTASKKTGAGKIMTYSRTEGLDAQKAKERRDARLKRRLERLEAAEAGGEGGAVSLEDISEGTESFREKEKEAVDVFEDDEEEEEVGEEEETETAQTEAGGTVFGRLGQAVKRRAKGIMSSVFGSSDSGEFVNRAPNLRALGPSGRFNETYRECVAACMNAILEMPNMTDLVPGGLSIRDSLKFPESAKLPQLSDEEQKEVLERTNWKAARGFISDALEAAQSADSMLSLAPEVRETSLFQALCQCEDTLAQLQPSIEQLEAEVAEAKKREEAGGKEMEGDKEVIWVNETVPVDIALDAAAKGKVYKIKNITEAKAPTRPPLSAKQLQATLDITIEQKNRLEEERVRHDKAAEKLRAQNIRLLEEGLERFDTKVLPLAARLAAWHERKGISDQTASEAYADVASSIVCELTDEAVDALKVSVEDVDDRVEKCVDCMALMGELYQCWKNRTIVPVTYSGKSRPSRLESVFLRYSFHAQDKAFTVASEMNERYTNKSRDTQEQGWKEFQEFEKKDREFEQERRRRGNGTEAETVAVDAENGTSTVSVEEKERETDQEFERRVKEWEEEKERRNQLLADKELEEMLEFSQAQLEMSQKFQKMDAYIGEVADLFRIRSDVLDKLEKQAEEELKKKQDKQMAGAGGLGGMGGGGLGALQNLMRAGGGDAGALDNKALMDQMASLQQMMQGAGAGGKGGLGGAGGAPGAFDEKAMAEMMKSFEKMGIGAGGAGGPGGGMPGLGEGMDASMFEKMGEMMQNPEKMQEWAKDFAAQSGASPEEMAQMGDAFSNLDFSEEGMRKMMDETMAKASPEERKQLEEMQKMFANLSQNQNT